MIYDIVNKLLYIKYFTQFFFVKYFILTDFPVKYFPEKPKQIGIKKAISNAHFSAYPASKINPFPTWTPYLIYFFVEVDPIHPTLLIWYQLIYKHSFGMAQFLLGNLHFRFSLWPMPHWLNPTILRIVSIWRPPGSNWWKNIRQLLWPNHPLSRKTQIRVLGPLALREHTICYPWQIYFVLSFFSTFL